MTAAVGRGSGRGGLWQRWVGVGRPPRIAGLDVARALAVVGMIGAHVGIVGADETGEVLWSSPETWSGLVNGRSSLLFALLAGISVALLTGGATPPVGQELSRARLKMVGRGLAILAIGLVLELLGTPVVIILTFYGVLFMLAPVFLTWRPRALFVTAGVLALFGPPVIALIRSLTLDSYAAGTRLLLTGPYQLSVWLVFLLVGLALGRLDLRSTALAVRMLVIGAGLAVVGYTLGVLVQDSAIGQWEAAVTTRGDAPTTYAERLADSEPVQRVLANMLAVHPHSGGILEIVGSGGFVLAATGLCLWLTPRLRLVLVPVIAVGSMPLTAYSLQILTISVAQGGPGGEPLTGNGFWAWMVVGLVVVCTAWALTLGRGPLERLMARAGTALADPPGAAANVATQEQAENR